MKLTFRTLERTFHTTELMFRTMQHNFHLAKITIFPYITNFFTQYPQKISC